MHGNSNIKTYNGSVLCQMFTHQDLPKSVHWFYIIMSQQINISVGDVKICTMVLVYTGHKYVQSIIMFYLLDK